jgi:predicted alpha-1,6-mannanase (GH76 family)
MLRTAGIKPFLLLASALFSGCAAVPARNGQSAPSLDAHVNLQDSTDAVQTLQTWYQPSTGSYKTTGWWNSANAITVLVDYARLSKSKQYNSVFVNTFTAAQRANPGFLNKFYDDEGWWALGLD